MSARQRDVFTLVFDVNVGDRVEWRNRPSLIEAARGGTEAQYEAHLMVSEKINASFEAGATLIDGATAADIISRYREHVAANANRLSLIHENTCV